MDNPEELARSCLQDVGYAEDARVRAAFLIGSTASGQNDVYSDIDITVAVTSTIPRGERLRRLVGVGCHDIMLMIAGSENPTLPVHSEAIDKFVFQDTWFDVSYNLPHQLGQCFDYIVLLDKDDLASRLCDSQKSYKGTGATLQARGQANLRLLHVRIHRYEKYARRAEWIGLDLSAIHNAFVDLLMVLNNHPNYNRYSSHITTLLRGLPVKPCDFERDFLDILHLDSRGTWQHKLDLMRALETDLTALCRQRWGGITMRDDESLSDVDTSLAEG